MRRIGLSALCLVLLVVPATSKRDDSQFKGFTFSPDGTYVLAVHFHHGSSFIYKIPLDTGKATRFTFAKEGFEGVPSFSPDGKRVIYSSSPGRSGTSRLVVANADGSDAHPLAHSGTNDFRPLFSPDNKTIIFARFGYYGSYSPIAQPAAHQWNFYASDLDGTNVRQLTNETFYMVSRACVSPDGKSLLFVSTEDHGDVVEIYSLEQPPKPKEILIPHVQREPGEPLLNDPNFFPDGKSIVFVAASGHKWKNAFDYDVYRMDLETKQIEKLTEANGYAYGLQLSRDGRTAIFLKDIKKGTKVFLLDLGTHKVTPFEVTGLD